VAERAVGFDPGSKTPKAVLLERRGGRWAVLETRIGAEGALPKGPVWACLPSQMLTVREIRHPLTDPARIAQTIRYEAEPYLSMPLEQCVLQYQILDAAEGGSRILLLAAPKEKLGASLEAWKAAGIDPAVVTADAAALWNCYAAFGAEIEAPVVLLDVPPGASEEADIPSAAATGEAVVLLDLGAHKTTLLLFEGNRLRLMRVLRVGLEPPAQGDATMALKEAMEVLVQEVRRSWAAAGVEEKLSKVLLTGGGALHPAAPNLLGERFRCPVGRYRFLEHLEHRLTAPQAETFEALGACAVGAALGALGADTAGVDFRREEFRYRGRLPRLAGALSAACLTAAAFLAVLGLGMQRKASWGRAELARLQEHQAKALELVRDGMTEGHGGELGDILHADRSAEAILTDAAAYLESKRQTGGGARDLVSVLDLLRELFQRIPSEYELTVTEMQASQAAVTLKGILPDQNLVFALSDRIAKPPSPFLTDPANAVPKDGAYAFTLSARRRIP